MPGNHHDYTYWRNKYLFGGNREIVLSRDEYKCRVCQSNDNLHVHHKDGYNYKNFKDEANNDPSNLITLCGRCHNSLHRLQRRKKRVYLEDDELIRVVSSWIELVDPLNRAIYYGDY